MTIDEISNADSGDALSGNSLQRREFLKLLGPGIYIFFQPGDSFALGQEPRGGRGYPEDFNAYLRIDENGKVHCYTGKIEMGQGINAALAQMLAEELAVSFNSVTTVLGDTKLCPWDGGTNGSRSIKYFGPALRAAGAEAREVLIQLAAEHLKLPAGGLLAKDGFVVDKSNPATRVAYGALAKGKTIDRHLDKKPGLKAASEFSVCGKSLPRPDGSEKVAGKALYAGDVRLPGMLYAKMLRPPAHGAKMTGVDVAGAKEIRDARVVQDGDFIAVLHPAPDLAEKALSRVKAQFDIPEAKVNDDNIHESLMQAAAQGDVIQQKGDMTLGRGLATVKFDEIYRTPYVAHAPIETHSAVAQVEGNEATVWISTQRPFGARDEIAKALGFPPEKVRIIVPYVGGGFGGKSQIRQAIEAVRLSKMVGSPVHVAWTREEEFFFDTFMPAAFVQISSGLNASGQIVFWDYKVCFAGERSSQTFYDIPHYRTINAGGRMPGGSGVHPFGTGAWRGPGSNTNIFARESHMDVMAARAGMDPMEFRLKNLSDQRMIKVLKAAADKFGWTPAKTPSGRGYGLACLDYLGTYIAAMAEIKVDKNTGRIRVVRVVGAQDMGPIINPEGARMQIEGCITMGLGYVLSEQIHFNGGDIKDRGFDAYDIARFSWAPKIDAVLIDNHEIQPQGCGEPMITCMGGLIANALFDATGIRVRQLPLTPGRIKGLKAKG